MVIIIFKLLPTQLIRSHQASILPARLELTRGAEFTHAGRPEGGLLGCNTAKGMASFLSQWCSWRFMGFGVRV